MTTDRITHHDRPAPTVAALNARVTAEQMNYLQDLADDLGVTLSAAIRRAIDQSRLFDVASGRTPLVDETGAEQPGARQFVLGATPIDELDDGDGES